MEDLINHVPWIWIDSGIQGGRSCLRGTRITTDTLAERFLAGESVAALAADFRVAVERVEAALRYEWERPKRDRAWRRAKKAARMEAQ